MAIVALIGCCSCLMMSTLLLIQTDNAAAYIAESDNTDTAAATSAAAEDDDNDEATASTTVVAADDDDNDDGDYQQLYCFKLTGNTFWEIYIEQKNYPCWQTLTLHIILYSSNKSFCDSLNICGTQGKFTL